MNGYEVAESASAKHIERYFEFYYNNGKKKHPVHGYKSYYRLLKPKSRLSDDISALES